MTKKLHISTTLSMPLEALTKSFMIVGQRGSGKTNLGVVMCEEFSAAGLPFIVSDPLGVWSGLRSSRDGKKAGLPVYILGGEHGDAPLEPTAGGIVADALVEASNSFVLDLSLMRKGQRIHFMADFCERVFEAKATNRAPLHLMFDEADEVAPQNLRHESGGMAPRLLGAVEDLVRRGRSRGIGFTGITQRPASLNKNVLSQADVMTVFRLAAPQDRAALDEWVKANATREQIDVFTRELPELQTGHAFVWSPAWLKIFKRVHIRHRETFDSSATPEVGVVASGPKVMAKVDIAALRERIEATVEAKKAEDPRLLRARIAALESQIATRAEPAPAQIVERSVLERSDVDGLRSFLVDFEDILGNLKSFGDKIVTALNTVDRGPSPAAPPAMKTGFTPPTAPAAPTVRVSRSSTPADSSLRPAELKLLQVLAVRAPKPTNRDQLAILSGYSSTSGSFGQAIANLRTRGFITDGLPMFATDAGRKAAGPVEAIPSGAQLLDYWYAKVTKAEATLLRTIADARPSALSRDALAKATGYSATSGSFGQAIANLRTLELIERREFRLSSAFEDA